MRATSICLIICVWTFCRIRHAIAQAGLENDFPNLDLNPNPNSNQINLFDDDHDIGNIQRNSDEAPIFSSNALTSIFDDEVLSSQSISFDGTGSSLEDPLFNNNGKDNIFPDVNNVLLEDDKQTNSNLFALNPAEDSLSLLPSSSQCPSSSSSSSSPLSRHRLRVRETNNGGFCMRTDGTGIDFLGQDQVRKYWCSQTEFPDFLNIPVCRNQDLDRVNNQQQPLEIPGLVVPEEVRIQLMVTGYINLAGIFHSKKQFSFGLFWIFGSRGRRFLGFGFVSF